MDGSKDPFTMLAETPPFFSSWYTWAAILGVAILAGFRQWLRGPQYFSQTSMKGKVALVTGGNRGLGFYTAKELAVRGAKVYIGCRDSELGREAEDMLRRITGNKEIHFLSLKMGSIEEVRKFAAIFQKKEEKLDVLVCNAGVMTCPHTKTVDGFEYHLGVNYIGHHVLVNELLPQLKAATPSRVIILTSAAYALGKIQYDDINLDKIDYGNGAECFSQSKLALVMMGNKLSRMLADTGVTVNCCHPGVARTDIHRNMPIKSSTFLYVSTFPLVWYLMKSANDGAQTPIYLSIDEAVKETTGKYFVDMQEKPLEGDLAGNAEETDKLWKFTEKIIEEADKKRAENKVSQSEQEPEVTDKSGEKEVGQGDKKND